MEDDAALAVNTVMTDRGHYVTYLFWSFQFISDYITLSQEAPGTCSEPHKFFPPHPADRHAPASDDPLCRGFACSALLAFFSGKPAGQEAQRQAP